MATTSDEGFIGTWGLYPQWDKSELMHPEDYDDFRGLTARLTKVFYCQGITGDGYLVLSYGDKTIRARSEGYSPVPNLPFSIGVQVRIKKHPARAARVIDIGWHTNKGREMYFLEVAGKKDSRRYWREELDPLPDTNAAERHTMSNDE